MQELECVSDHFKTFYLPLARSVQVCFKHVHTFDVAIFPNLRRLEVGHLAYSFGLYQMDLSSVEAAIAIVDGAIDKRLLGLAQQRWAGEYTNSVVKRWQNIVANDQRCFKVIDTAHLGLDVRDSQYGPFGLFAWMLSTASLDSLLCGHHKWNFRPT